MTNVSDRDLDAYLLHLKVLRSLRRVLAREKQAHQSNLYARYGLGMTREQFDWVVQSLVKNDWCHIKQGSKGGTLVVFNEVFNGVAVPEGENA